MAAIVDQRDSALVPAVVARRRGDDLATARNAARVHHGTRTDDHVLVDMVRAAAVGTDRPQALHVAEALVDILPAHVDHTAVIQNAGADLVDLAL